MLLDHSNDDDNGNDHDEDEEEEEEEEEEDEEPITAKRTYRCRNYKSCPHPVYSDDPNAECRCYRKMTSWMDYVAPPGAEVQVARGADSESDGFVKGVVTYMVMDDLEVKPMSTISSLTLLNKFNVKQVGVLQEKVVHVGVKEAVKLLKTSLTSNKVLTEVFLSKN